MSERPTVYRCGNVLFFPRRGPGPGLDCHPRLPGAWGRPPRLAPILPFPSARRRSPPKPPLPHPA